MKKILLVITMFVFNINLFSFSLNNLEFDEVLKKDEVKIKEYVLKNNTKGIKKYIISTDSTNIEVKPRSFVLLPQKEKNFNIKVFGKGIDGANEFNLVITEKSLNKDSIEKNAVYLNKIVQIKQKYFLR